MISGLLKSSYLKRILVLGVSVFSLLTDIADADVSDLNDRLIKAAALGNLTEVEDALIAGADIDEKKPENGMTALILAAQNGHMDIVKLLCEYGSDPNIKATIGNIEYSALSVAMQMESKDIVGILESIGAKR